MKVVDESTSTLDKIRGNFTTFTNRLNKQIGGLLVGYVGFQGLKNAVISVSKAYLDQERAERTLAAAMRERNAFTEIAFSQYTKLAEQIQRTTMYSDDETLQVIRLATQYGLYGNAIDKAVKAATNFAAAQEMDLAAAMELVLKSVTSSTNAMARYGISVDGSAGSSERLNSLLAGINEKFSGAAQAQLQGYAGQIDNLKDQFDELKESIGKVTVPMATWTAQYINFVVGANAKLVKNIVGRFSNTSGIDQFGYDLATTEGRLNHYEALIEELFQKQNRTAAQTKIMNQYIAERNKLLSEMSKVSDHQTKGGIVPSKGAGGDSKKKEDSLAKEIEALHNNPSYMASKWEDERYQQQLDNEKKIRDLQHESNELYLQGVRERIAAEEAAQQAKIANLQGFVSTSREIADMFKNDSKGMFEMAKGIAIAEATINAYQSITKTLAQGGAFAMPLAIATGAMALAQVAKIAQTEYKGFAEGGFPQGRNAVIRVNERGQEAILNARATAVLGRDAINALNAGRQPAQSGPVVVVVNNNKQGDIGKILEGATRDRSINWNRILAGVV